MAGARGDEELFAGRGAMGLAVDLELDVALDDHDELVGVVRGGSSPTRAAPARTRTRKTTSSS
jgi:hypothetical protein